MQRINEMSYKIWVHKCKEHDNTEVELMEKICPECGEQGTFNGWGQSVIEMMASYQNRYNLRALFFIVGKTCFADNTGKSASSCDSDQGLYIQSLHWIL